MACVMENQGTNYWRYGMRDGYKGYRLSDVSRPLTFSASGFCLNASKFATRIARRSAAALRRNSVCASARLGSVRARVCAFLRACLCACGATRACARPVGSCGSAGVFVLCYPLARACADSCMGVSECARARVIHPSAHALASVSVHAREWVRTWWPRRPRRAVRGAFASHPLQTA